MQLTKSVMVKDSLFENGDVLDLNMLHNGVDLYSNQAVKLRECQDSLIEIVIHCVSLWIDVALNCTVFYSFTVL